MGRIVCVVQARVNSTRLPNKVLLDLNGASMLERVVTRVYHAKDFFDDLVVATGTIPSNDIIEDICRYNNWACFRGDEHDVLSRFYNVAERFEASTIIRICADDPVVDPNVISESVDKFFNSGVDYAATETLVKTFPVGIAVEVMTMDVLREAYLHTPALDREHVTPYIWKSTNKFNMVPITHDEDLSHIWLTVDNMADYRKIRKLYEAFGNSFFRWEDAVQYLERKSNGFLFI